MDRDTMSSITGRAKMDGDTPVLLVGVRERGEWGRTHYWKGKDEWGLMVWREKDGDG